MDEFRSPDESIATEGVALLSESIVPWVHLLPFEGEHAQAIETIRGDWCNCCSNNLSSINKSVLGVIFNAIYTLY